MKRFWVSWYQPGEDWRPIYPDGHGRPFDGRYWKSGERCSDDATTVCAVVDAESEDDAKDAIQVFWPEAGEWRFCEEKAMDWTPGDRFPMKATKKS